MRYVVPSVWAVFLVVDCLRRIVSVGCVQIKIVVKLWGQHIAYRIYTRAQTIRAFGILALEYANQYQENENDFFQPSAILRDPRKETTISTIFNLISALVIPAFFDKHDKNTTPSCMTRDMSEAVLSHRDTQRTNTAGNHMACSAGDGFHIPTITYFHGIHMFSKSHWLSIVIKSLMYDIVLLAYFTVNVCTILRICNHL